MVISFVEKVLRVLRFSNVPSDAKGVHDGVAPWRRGGEAGDRNGPKGHIWAEAGEARREL